jgi:Cof subfamily protein (haloacid dehalogenase superfamily)
MTHLSGNYSIVASDLDGTLLAPDHKISDHSKRTLQTLHAKGYTFIFATGRHHIDVSGIRELLGIPAYMITSNGARIHNSDNQLMAGSNVPEHVIQPIIDIVKNDESILIHLYRDNGWLLSRENQQIHEHYAHTDFHFSCFDPNNAPTDGVIKLFMTQINREHEQLAEFEEKINALFGKQLSVAFSTPYCLEVMGPEVSKGNALKLVAESLGKTLNDCIAFGDGMNDYEMLTMAGKGLVMATAHDRLLNALPPKVEKIGSNADDAVANYLLNNVIKSG